MLSHSISFGNNQSELQFIGDLIKLCNRHEVSCGQPQDLEHLGDDVMFNDAFRADLFALCAAISHMSEVELSPAQLLDLVARAYGGPGTTIGKGTAGIPRDASSAFLKSYKTWSSRECDRDALLPLRKDRNQIPTPYFTAASRSGSPPPKRSKIHHKVTPRPVSLHVPPSPPTCLLKVSP